MKVTVELERFDKEGDIVTSDPIIMVTTAWQSLMRRKSKKFVQQKYLTGQWEALPRPTAFQGTNFGVSVNLKIGNMRCKSRRW